MKYRILIVDDVIDTTIILREMLESLGYYIVDTDNGKTAFELFNKEPFDLVITDIVMPTMGGLTLLGKIKQKSPETPVIILSFVDELKTVVEALRLGASDYITKPFDESELMGSLERVNGKIGTKQPEPFQIENLKGESQHLVLDNNPNQIYATADFLCRNLDLFGMKQKRLSIKTALIEAISNAIYHGNLEMSSILKARDDIDHLDSYAEKALERFKNGDYQARKVVIDYRVDDEKICYTIQDDGNGFDHRNLPDPLDPKNFYKPSGRGILMIRNFCDEIIWNDIGNKITLIKYR